MTSRRLAAFIRAVPLIEAIERRGMVEDVVAVALAHPETIRTALLWELLTEVRARASLAGPTGSVFHGVRILPIVGSVEHGAWQGEDDCAPHEIVSAALHHGILALLTAYCRERPKATLDAQSAHDALLPLEAAAQFVEYFLGDPRACTSCAARALTLVTSTAARVRCLTRCCRDARHWLKEVCVGPYCPDDAWRVALWCLAQLPRNDNTIVEARWLMREHPHALHAYRTQPAHRSVLEYLAAVEATSAPAIGPHVDDHIR